MFPTRRSTTRECFVQSVGCQAAASRRRHASARLVPLRLTKRKMEHAVILKVVATNICGSDQHMVRGRTSAPVGLSLGHEITGEVIEL